MIYAFAQLTVTDPEKIAQYRERAGAALAKHGGSVVQASGKLTVLDGAPDLPTVAALLSFPDTAAAEAWANDPELAETHGFRRAAGRSEIFALG